MAEIRIKHLHKRFADFTAVKDSSLVLEDGKFVVLLGPSGCGKTTTLRMLAGLEYPSSGQITLDGDDVTYLRPRERDIAMVFQLFALYPHMGVRGNLEFPLVNEGVPRAEIDRRVNEVAAILRIEHLLGEGVGGLAGGDRQRVALGRAIVRQPKAFLMDEPLGTLDAEFRELMCVELRKLHDRLRTTTVFVTHDQNEAMALADHVVVMDGGEILQADTPQGVYDFPSCLFVARFIAARR
jgi:multiple sugar transport system ATP-binding protein